MIEYTSRTLNICTVLRKDKTSFEELNYTVTVLADG